MATVLVTCTIVLVIILATLVVGITTALVASRYCKCKSGPVFVVPEVAPSWEKAVVVQPPPIAPPPPPPCIYTTTVCPSPPLPPPPILRVNAQKISRPSGPCHRWQRRIPPATLHCNCQLPNLIQLPPSRPGRAFKLLSLPLPRAQPFKIVVEFRLPKPRGARLPQKELRPCKPSYPRPTKLAEGLKTPPLPFRRIMSSLTCKLQRQRHAYTPLGKLRGTPSSAPTFFLVVPRLVPAMPWYQVRSSQRKVVSFGSHQAPGRLYVEPCGDFRMEEGQVRSRQPGESQKAESLQRPATNPALCCTSTAGKLDRPSGPCDRLKHRDPTRVQYTVELPKLMRLPAKTTGIFQPMLPQWLSCVQASNVKEIKNQIPLPPCASAFPLVELKPQEAKATQSAEGLNTTPVAFNLISYAVPYKPPCRDSDPVDQIHALPNIEPPLLLVAPCLVPFIEIKEPTGPVEVFVLIQQRALCSSRPGRLHVEPDGSFSIGYPQWSPRLPRPTAVPEALPLPAVNLLICLKAAPPRPSSPPRKRSMSGYLTSTLGGPWWKQGPNPPKVEASASPQCHYGDPFWMERVEVSVDTPLKSGREPSQPGKRPSRKKPSSPKSRQRSKSLRHGAAHGRDQPSTSINAGLCNEGRKLVLLEISTPPERHQAALLTPVEVPVELSTHKFPVAGAHCGPVVFELGHSHNTAERRTISETIPVRSRDRPRPLTIGVSAAPECHHAPFWTENVEAWVDQEESNSPGHSGCREPTPGPSDYNPEHPAIHGRIPGRVPGFPKIRRDPDIRL